MTLGFKTKIGNEPTLFVEKIWTALNLGIGEYQLEFKERQEWLKKCIYSFNLLPEYLAEVPPKIHTIRADPKNRWQKGKNIHFVINNRTPKRFQFAPLLPVKFVQAIDIHAKDRRVYVGLNGTMNLLSSEGVEILAKNDGFSSVDAFFDYFNEDFSGKIIHWTDFVYS